jgi:hypothetical protein
MSGPASIESGRNYGSGEASHPHRLLARGWQWVCRSMVRSGRGITLDVSGPAQPSRGRAKWVFAFLLFLSITAVAVAEYGAGRGLIPIAWLAVGPLLGSLVLSPRITCLVLPARRRRSMIRTGCVLRISDQRVTASRPQGRAGADPVAYVPSAVALNSVSGGSHGRGTMRASFGTGGRLRKERMASASHCAA